MRKILETEDARKTSKTRTIRSTKERPAEQPEDIFPDDPAVTLTQAVHMIMMILAVLSIVFPPAMLILLPMIMIELIRSILQVVRDRK